MRRAGLAGGAVVLFCLVVSCLVQLHCDQRYGYFVVRVDSLVVPDSLPHTDTLRIRLFGTIGGSSAYSLDRIDVEFGEHGVDLTVWGKFDRKAVVVFDLMVELRKSYDVYPVAPGEFRIRVHQPDSTILSDSTTVF